MKVFITGTFRAGTTLVSQVLNQTHELNVTYDSVHFMRYGFQRYGRDGLSREAALALGREFNERLTTRFKRGFDLAAYEQRLAEDGPITYAHAYDAMMQLYVGHRNWGEKTVLQWRNAADILGMFDDMVIVHCIRDPRDVVSSWQKETIAPGVDYLDALANTYDSMKVALENQERFGKCYFILKYEELIAAPDETVRRMFDAVGLAFTPQALDTDRYKNKVTQERWEPNTAFGDAIEGISSRPLGRWRDHLCLEDLILCELVNRRLMEKFGYELSGTLDELEFADVYRAITRLQQSPLAYGGVLNVVHFQEGVQRNPLSEFDPTSWELDVAKM